MTRFVPSQLTLAPVALAAALALSLTACGGDDKKSGSAPSTPTGTTPTPSVISSAPSDVVVTRTKAELTEALLALKDLPSGFSEEKDEADESKPFSSPSSRCKTLVKYLNATKAPGAKVSVSRSFSGSQEGPYIDFGLDAMGTSKKVADLQKTYAEAVDDCPKVTLKTTGEANTTMNVEKLPAPKYGTSPQAFKLTGTSGPKRGLEFTALTTGVNDVVVSVSVLAGQGSELDPATETAVTKAQQALKTA
ncbi:hypothetical protein [Kribbella sp. NPDC055071]